MELKFLEGEFLSILRQMYYCVASCKKVSREFTQHDASAHDEPKESRN